MTKKLILLILALPLFLMICLFTATSGVSLAVPISVSGIELSSESYVEMDLDNPREQHVIDYTVYPTNAANQAVTVSYEPLVDDTGAEQRLAQFSYDEETRTLKPLSPGSAEVVITTVDGGFKARFTVYVKTKQLVSVEASHPSLGATVDEETGADKYILNPGEEFVVDIKCEPAGAQNVRVDVKSSNPEVVSVIGKRLKANGVGRSIITVTSRANKYISDSFVIEVENPENQSIVIVDKNVSTIETSGSIPISIYATTAYTLDAKVVDGEGNEIKDAYNYVRVWPNANNTAIEYYFVEDYYGTTFIDVTLKTDLGEVTTIRCSATKLHPSEQGEFRIEFDNSNYGMVYDQYDDIYFRIWPDDGSMDLEFKVEFNNGNVLVDQEIIPVGGSFYQLGIYSKFAGISELTVTATDKVTGQTTTKTVPITVKPSMIGVTPPKYDGIEGSFTIGKYNANHTESSPSLYEYVLNYKISDKVGEGFYENLKWISSSDAVYVDENGKIVFVEGKDIEDFVTFTVVFSANGVETKSQAIKIRCVSNGYNATSYKELLKLTNEGKVVVLQNDIVDDFGKDLTGFEYPLYTEMQSTYDTTWYKNQGREAEAKIKVLISFRASVYGNGHEINANNVVSVGQNSSFAENGQPQLTNDAIFRGPLSFVGLADGKGQGGAVTVAAQDNICFAAYDNVTLNNVVLTGRNMISENGTYNLQQLHYAGTVVEVFGDVNIEYSRVRNGRNVIRAFGDDTPFGDVGPDRNINLSVTNSVLSNGRDFIMRVGSNKFIDGREGDKDALSPYIRDDDPTDRVDYSMRHHYSDDKYTDGERSKYDEQFIRTFVTLKNSVLEEPGIFGIGVDSHFAGTALQNGENFKEYAANSEALNYWKNMAKTSYGVKLTLSGDVRMYCWKDLNTVDSTSLIETMNGFNLGLLSAESLAFDIPTLVRSAVNSNSNLVNVVYNPEVNKEVSNGKGTWMQIWNRDANNDGIREMQEYDKVHAGIAFFGGGKNYGVLHYDNFDFYEFSKPYEISLADAGRYELTLAAGNEEFYFVLYDSTTLNFLYEKQAAMKGDPEEGYSCLYKK